MTLYLCPDQTGDASTENHRDAPDFPARIDCIESKRNGHPTRMHASPPTTKGFTMVGMLAADRVSDEDGKANQQPG
jgi:hypothetical protein